jgi:hypothetical protein
MKAMDLPHRTIEMVNKVDTYFIVILFSVAVAAVGAILSK